MFEDLFSYPKHISRHREGPCAKARERFLAHCAGYGAARQTLKLLAGQLLRISQCVDVTSGRRFTPREVEAAMQACRSCHRGHRHRNYKKLVSVATVWLRFLGSLEEPKKDKSRFAKQLNEFCAYQRAERGLSANTIEARRKQVADFLELLDRRRRSLRQVTVGDVDSYFTLKGIQGCCRLTIRTRADSLRSFFRYAEFRHWCISGIAAGITAPRVFKYEGVPAGPSWQQVRQIIAGANGPAPGDARDRAILLLLATYGLRSSEIRGLRLEDLDWVHEIITIRRPKRGRTEQYPLVSTVGDAIVYYLQRARPRCSHRELFVTLRAPFRPMSQICVYATVSKRVRALNIQVQHRGPHCLRHACAGRLLAQGSSLKEIGDHLGHRTMAATAVYAKVDLAGLRQVAEFDLKGLLS